ncbi:putative amidohydrolase [Klebsiella michiganensis]|nr:putative amidohydrolase [Klebsiella michiganensis]
MYVAGKLIAREGALLESIPPAAGITPPRDTLQMPPLSPDDFILRVGAIRHGVARLRHIRGARFTHGERLRCRSAMAGCKSRTGLA